MEQNQPLVSVIIPCYNQAQYLPDALQSVLDQSYTNWECIIVNDGSTDNAEEVADIWIKKDARLKYLKKENGGLSSARNAGLDVAKGHFIQFLDADDVINSEKFNVQVSGLSGSANYSLSISDYFTSTESDLKEPFPGRYITPEFKSSCHLRELISAWETGLSIPVHCFLLKSALFKENNIHFNEQLPNHEDWECWMNIFRLNPEVRFVDQKLATYRIRESAMCYDRALMKQGFLQAIDIQKNKFDGHSQEYGLLVKKINQVKYGVFSRNLIRIFIVLIYRNTRRIAARLLRRLKILKPTEQVNI